MMSVNFNNTAYFKAWFRIEVSSNDADGIMRIFYSYAC